MSESRKGLLENEIKIKEEPPDIDPYPGNLYPVLYTSSSNSRFFGYTESPISYLIIYKLLHQNAHIIII